MRLLELALLKLHRWLSGYAGGEFLAVEECVRRIDASLCVTSDKRVSEDSCRREHNSGVDH